MRGVAEGLVYAFSRFSILPVPKFSPSREGVGYTFCFLPMVGVVSCILLLLWHQLCLSLSLSPLLFAVVCAIICAAVGRGVHLGGMMNSVDALFSNGVREKKLELLRSRQPGRTGTLFGLFWLLLQLGLWHQLYGHTAYLLLASVGCIWSRALLSLSAAVLPGPINAAPKATVFACFLYVGAGMSFSMQVALEATGVTLLLLAGWLLVYRRISSWEFGGNSLTLTGLLQQGAEMLCLLTAAAGAVAAAL